MQSKKRDFLNRELPNSTRVQQKNFIFEDKDSISIFPKKAISNRENRSKTAFDGTRPPLDGSDSAGNSRLDDLKLIKYAKSNIGNSKVMVSMGDTDCSPGSSPTGSTGVKKNLIFDRKNTAPISYSGY